MFSPFLLLLPRRLYEEMVSQALAELPNECCGLLAGTLEDNPPGLPLARVVRRYPLVNAAASPREYDAEPRDLFAAHRAMRQAGLEVLAIYHSHPTAEAVPSRTDLSRNYWPDVIAFIISLKGSEPVMRAWWLNADNYQEAQWQWLETP